MSLKKITPDDCEAMTESGCSATINVLARALDAAVKALRGSAGPDEISNARQNGEAALKAAGVK